MSVLTRLGAARTEVSERAQLLKAGIKGQSAIREHCVLRLDKYSESGQLVDTLNREYNLLMYGGASTLWECLIGNGTATASQTLTFFNNGNAYIGVGDSTTAAAATQTDLQASSNKLRKVQNATYPVHADGTTSGSATIQFQATFGSTDANFAWQEWGIFNGSSAGRMLNRKVESLGTKGAGSTWVLTLTLSLA